MIIGIDPGLTGAISVFNVSGDLYAVFDMPISAKTRGKGNQVNAGALADLVKSIDNGYLKPVTKAVIERVGAMPGQGVNSMFGFGRSLGVIEGILAANDIPVEWMTPQKWKKAAGLIGKDKDAARTLVVEKYPEHRELFKRKKDIGRADAVLIAQAFIHD